MIDKSSVTDRSLANGGNLVSERQQATISKAYNPWFILVRMGKYSLQSAFNYLSYYRCINYNLMFSRWPPNLTTRTDTSCQNFSDENSLNRNLCLTKVYCDYFINNNNKIVIWMYMTMQG